MTGKSNSPGMDVVGEPETALQNLVHYEERRYPESSVEDAECLSREIHGWKGLGATGEECHREQKEALCRPPCLYSLVCLHLGVTSPPGL